MLTPDYLFWFGAGLVATGLFLAGVDGSMRRLPMSSPQRMENRSHGSSYPERHRRMDGSPGIAAAAHDDPRLS